MCDSDTCFLAISSVMCTKYTQNICIDIENLAETIFFFLFLCCFKNNLYICNEYDKQTGMHRQNFGEQKYYS